MAEAAGWIAWFSFVAVCWVVLAWLALHRHDD